MLPIPLLLQLAMVSPRPEPALFPVGFEVIVVLDTTRTYVRSGTPGPRTISLYHWYPAQPGSGAGMRYRDYLARPADPGSRGSSDAFHWWRSALEQELDSTFETGDLAAIAGQAVRSRSGATPKPGPRPLVVFGAGLNAPAFLYVSLAEGLAERGYHVVTLPSFGPGDTTALSFDTSGVANQLADLGMALDRGRTIPGVDPGQVALAAWSVGAVATMLRAARVGDVRALVSLDGAAGYQYGVDLLTTMRFRPEDLGVPLLGFLPSLPGRFAVPRSGKIFQALSPGQVTVFRIPGFDHADFTSYYSEYLPSARRSHPGDFEVGKAFVLDAMTAFLSWAFTGERDGWTRFRDAPQGRELIVEP